MDATPRSYLVEALRWDAAGHPQRAMQLYAAAVHYHPKDTLLRMQLADCMARCGRDSHAAAEYLRIAIHCSQQHRDHEALALLSRALHLDSSHLVYVVLVDVLRRVGPEAQSLCGSVAKAHLAAGRLIDALYMLRLSVELGPSNPEPRRQLAALYRIKGMKRDAVAQLADAGRLLLAAGNRREYIVVAEQLLALDPYHLATHRGLCHALLLERETQRAVARLAQLMRLNPGDAIGYELLGHAYAVLDRRVTALLTLERLVDELRASHRVSMANAVLMRAREWRPEDRRFTAAVERMLEPSSPSMAVRVAPSESTVALDLCDVVELDAHDETMPLHIDEIIEIDGVEDSVAAAAANEPSVVHAHRPLRFSTQITVRYVAQAG
ncbi:MAG: hypothetical protein AAF799_27530 [Myxococcota bacterium]